MKNTFQKNRGVLDDLCDVIGYTATSTLVVWHGGSDLYVPKSTDGTHDLALLLGESTAAALMRAFGGDTVYIPADRFDAAERRHKAVVVALAAGASPAVTAAECGMSVRRVQQIRQRFIAAGIIPGKTPRETPGEKRPGKPRGKATPENAGQKPGGNAGVLGGTGVGEVMRPVSAQTAAVSTGPGSNLDDVVAKLGAWVTSAA